MNTNVQQLGYLKRANVRRHQPRLSEIADALRRQYDSEQHGPSQKLYIAHQREIDQSENRAHDMRIPGCSIHRAVGMDSSDKKALHNTVFLCRFVPCLLFDASHLCRLGMHADRGNTAGL
jgi:hypothetical protein